MKEEENVSHALPQPDEIRVLAGGGGLVEHIPVVAREGLTGTAHPPSSLFSVM